MKFRNKKKMELLEMTIRLTLLGSILLIFGCHSYEKDFHDARPDTAKALSAEQIFPVRKLELQDSLKNGKTVIVDTSTTFKKFLYFFSSSTKHEGDSKVEIPRAIFLSVFNDSTINWDEMSDGNPVEKIVNGYGTFFILKWNCGAGGECIEYYLIRYDVRGQLYNTQHIGDLMADEDFMITFQYDVIGDTILVAHRKEYDGNDKLTKASTSRIKLKCK